LEQEVAEKAAAKLSDNEIPAIATETLPRERYWKEMLGSSDRRDRVIG
jgi:hypothetical protein